jgi:hypothetical protein
MQPVGHALETNSNWPVREFSELPVDLLKWQKAIS